MRLLNCSDLTDDQAMLFTSTRERQISELKELLVTDLSYEELENVSNDIAELTIELERFRMGERVVFPPVKYEWRV